MPFLTEQVYQRLADNKGWREEEDIFVCQCLERQMTAAEIQLQLHREGFLRDVSQTKERIADLLMAGRTYDTLREFRASET